MPDSGHCSRAETSASCARSSAMPTSPTIRVSPAMTLADSILQIASIERCASVVVTTTDHIMCAWLSASRTNALRGNRLCTLASFEDLTNFALALAGNLQEFSGQLDCVLLGVGSENGESANHFF